jgi:hypothetical protein
VKGVREKPEALVVASARRAVPAELDATPERAVEKFSRVFVATA